MFLLFIIPEAKTATTFLGPRISTQKFNNVTESVPPEKQ